MELSGSAESSSRTEGPRVVPLGELVEGHATGPDGILDGPEKHRRRDAQGVVAVDVVVDEVAGEDQGLQHTGPVLVQRQYRPVLLADDPEVFDQGLYLEKAVRDPRAPGVTDEAVQSVHVQRTEEYVPEQVLCGRQAVRRLVAA